MGPSGPAHPPPATRPLWPCPPPTASPLSPSSTSFYPWLMTEAPPLPLSDAPATMLCHPAPPPPPHSAVVTGPSGPVHRVSSGHVPTRLVALKSMKVWFQFVAAMFLYTCFAATPSGPMMGWIAVQDLDVSHVPPCPPTSSAYAFLPSIHPQS
jgi:hypothetical protein